MSWQTKYPHLVPYTTVKIDSGRFSGTYDGPNFGPGLKSDYGHQLCNVACYVIGDKLKELYKNGDYKKVNFDGIRMMTSGMAMDSSPVQFNLYIPFISVTSKCDAYTSFDHAGGWGHSNTKLQTRLNELNSELLPGDSFDVSDLIESYEGLKEYWIQWRNKTTQKECQSSNQSVSSSVSTPPISNKDGDIEMDLPPSVTNPEEVTVTFQKEGYQNVTINPYGAGGHFLGLPIIEFKDNKTATQEEIDKANELTDEQINNLLKEDNLDPAAIAQKKIIQLSVKLSDKVMGLVIKQLVERTGITDPMGTVEKIKNIKEEGNKQLEELNKKEATLSGYVKDGTGLGLPGYKVNILGKGKGVLTDEDGFYSITLEKGDYDIAFRGYEGYKRESISLNRDETLNVSLGLGKVLEEVEIQGSKEEREQERKYEAKQEKREYEQLQRKLKNNTNEYSQISKLGAAGAGIGALFIQQEIMKLIQQNLGGKSMCPSPEVLSNIIEIKNSVTTQLNQAMKILNFNTKALGLTTNLIDLSKIALQFAKFSPIPIPPFSPVSLVGLIEDQKEFLDKDIIKKLGKITSGTLAILLVARQTLSTILQLLELLDYCIQFCSPDTIEYEQELSEELQQLQALQLEENFNPQPLQSNIVNGFQMEIETENTETPTKRKRAIAKDPNGVVALTGEWSFSSIEQILIDELVFYIQINDLKAT